jgi:FkbM family methyltransferase
MKWIAGCSNHGCWLGSYEYAKRKAFEKAVVEGSVVFDIGANVGFYTLLASVLVGPRGRVFAFEPVPANIRYLKAHLQLNHISNVDVIEAAVSDFTGAAHFDVGPNPSMGRLATGGSLTVRTVTLDEMVGRGELPPPDCLKIDVEGAEAQVLKGARALLSDHHPTIFLATHGSEIHSECCRLLVSLEYELKAINGARLDETDEIVASPRLRRPESHDAVGTRFARA